MHGPSQTRGEHVYINKLHLWAAPRQAARAGELWDTTPRGRAGRGALHSLGHDPWQRAPDVSTAVFVYL